MRPAGYTCINAGPEALIKVASATAKKGGTEMKNRNIPVITIVASLAVSGGIALAAQDKYSVQVPGGLAFSDFRGYEDWQPIAVSKTEDLTKLIVANPVMIDAYRAGVPGNGQPFPDGSKIVKLQWKPKKSTEAPFDVDVPDVFTQAFVIEKDSKRFPKSGGWGDARFNYDAAGETFTPDATALQGSGQACH